MKEFQRLNRTLNVSNGESAALTIKKIDAMNNKFAFVFSGVTSSTLASYVKIEIESGNSKVNLVTFSNLIIDGLDSCILKTDFPINSDIFVSVLAPSNGTISLSIFGGNF